MKFECKDLERALEVPALMPDAREHARSCPTCRHDLWLWSEMSGAAHGLRDEWETPELWSRIQLQISQEPRVVQRRFRWRQAAGIAALLTIGLSATGWYVWQPKAAAVPQSGDFLTEQALKEVQQAETAYLQSIEKLAKIAAPQIVKPPTSLAAAYREKLILLDAAIADLRSSIDHNRFNARLQTELAALYRQKKETLQEIVRYEQKN